MNLNLRRSLPKETVTDKQVKSLEETICTMIEGLSGKMPSPFQVGKKYMIRTVTMVNTGTCTKVYKDFVELSDAAWIADTGRFHESLSKPDGINEIEPFPNPIYVALGAIVDFTQLPEAYVLPRTAK